MTFPVVPKYRIIFQNIIETDLFCTSCINPEVTGYERLHILVYKNIFSVLLVLSPKRPSSDIHVSHLHVAFIKPNIQSIK